MQAGPELRLRFTSGDPPEEVELSAIRERLRRVHADLANVSFERVGALDQTVEGKTRTIVRQ